MLFKLSKRAESAVGRDWGIDLKRNIQYSKASQYFERSLKAKPLQFRTLFESSECKLKQNDADAALGDVNKCLMQKPNNTKAKHQKSKCLAGLNEIENAFALAHGILFEHPTNTSVHHTKNSLEMALRRSVCPSAKHVLRKYKTYLRRYQSGEQEVQTLERPVDQHHQSAIELLKHKVYFDSKFAEQVEFWSKIEQDQTLDQQMRQIVQKIMRNFETHENILYAREPFYAKQDRFDKGSLGRLRRRTFYYAQEETRREALWQLKNIKKLGESNFNAALALTERVLSEFYAVKRRVVFPAKFEFLCQVCSVISKEYLRIYRSIPANLMSLKTDERLVALFNVWGKMLQGEELCDKKVEYFNDRLKYADYDMEKAYIYHQLSEVCFRFRRPEESQRYARDVLSCANRCNNNTWAFLGLFNVIRVDAIKRTYHPMLSDLTKLQQIADNLDTFTQVFVKTAMRSFEDIKGMTN